MKNLEVTKFVPVSNINSIYRKESSFTGQWTLFGVKDGIIHEYAIVRTYQTQARVYVCAWLPKFSASGSGFAGGGGYDRESVAAEAALGKCGFNFDQNWGGALRIYDALHAIGRFLNVKSAYVVNAHA